MSGNGKFEQGAMTLFYAAVVLPLMFFLFILSVDLGTYYSEQTRIQKILDDAALYSQKFLPYQARAAAAARSFLARFELGGAPQVAVSAEGVSLAFSAQKPLSFARYFDAQAGLEMSAVSRVRSTPFDVYIAMDASGYLAPDPVSGGGENLWGDPLSWGAADFFLHERQFYFGDEMIDPRRTTQRCFNPPFSALKTSAIQAYEYYSGFAANAVGIGVFPGSGGNAVDEVRPLALAAKALDVGGEAQFIPLDYEWGGSGYCAAAAEGEITNGNYRFRAANSSIEHLWRPPAGAPNITDPLSGAFNPEYQNYLRASEVIWSRVAHTGLPESGQVLSDGFSRIAPAFFEERGGLQGRSRRQLVILAGDLPYSSGQVFPGPGGVVADDLAARFEIMRQVIATDRTLRLSMIYVLLLHERSRASLPLEAQTFENFLQQQSLVEGQASERFSLKLLIGSSPEYLIRQLSAALLLDRKSVVLSK
ncbi:MAG: hypothetical protein DCC75_00055 [Proteobacteria bacterium]|nr:MAG: hypothetical protein DCC75_00055 [Pseudomonadota bacterium]